MAKQDKQTLTVTNNEGAVVEAVTMVPVMMGMTMAVDVAVTGVNFSNGAVSLNCTPSSKGADVPDFWNGTLVEDGGNPGLGTATFTGVNFDDIYSNGSGFVSHGRVLQGGVEIATVEFLVESENGMVQ